MRSSTNDIIRETQWEFYLVVASYKTNDHGILLSPLHAIHGADFKIEPIYWSKKGC